MNDDQPIGERIAAERARLRRLGWTEDDLSAFERWCRRRDPGGGDGDVFLWAMLGTCRELPPVTPRTTARGDDRILAKVRALLAKAESTTFSAEAEACSAKAQELVTRYRLEGVSAESAASGPGGRRVWLEAPYLDSKASLLGAVAVANSCEAIRIGGTGCVHLVGFERDLEMVELLFTSLLVQAGSAMSQTGSQVDEFGRLRTRSFRRDFLRGYAWRVGRRLREVNLTGATDADASAGGDLLPVLRRRDEAVAAKVEELFPRVRTRTDRDIGNAAGWGAGVVAADRAELTTQPRFASTDVPALGH